MLAVAAKMLGTPQLLTQIYWAFEESKRRKR